MTLCRVLTELGVYPTLRKGRPCIYTPDEARRVKKEQVKIAAFHRNELIHEAAAKGEPPPVFKRGRPRIYATEEESILARKRMNKVCNSRHEALMTDALEDLRKHVAHSRQMQERSADEP